MDQEISLFPDLEVCKTLLDPYLKLWTTSYDFHCKYEIWSEGPFMGLDADAIAEDVENMWKTLYKLSRSFQDQPGPKRTAEVARAKIERFRAFLPLLQTICNPGLRKRHWKQVTKSFLILSILFLTHTYVVVDILNR